MGRPRFWHSDRRMALALTIAFPLVALLVAADAIWQIVKDIWSLWRTPSDE